MEPTSTTSVDKEYFYTALEAAYSHQKNKLKKPWSLQRHSEVIEIIMGNKDALQSKVKRTNQQYYFGNNYDIIEMDGIKKVIKKRKNEYDAMIFPVPYEEIFDKLINCHESTGHGGRDKMKNVLNQNFYIQRICIEIFLKCCKTCVEKRSQSHKGMVEVVKPIVSKDWNHRGQVDLIDLQATPDGEYKWLMNYQDHLTKFIHLRPLKSDNEQGVSFELLKIFLEFGAPQILQSDYGREFVNTILKDLASKWPECKIVNGRATYPQGLGSVERSNQDVEKKLRTWLKKNNTQNWSLGCYFVQRLKNSSYHSKIGRSPFKAVFGIDFKLGLKSSYLPHQTIHKISTEEELYDILENTKTSRDIDTEPTT